jgi:hypothetical protein
MPPAPAPAPGSPPATAITAAVLGVVSAAVPTLALLFIVVMAGSDLWEMEAVWLLVPLLVVVGLVAGAVLLLTGRSWRVLAASAGALTALVLVAFTLGGWGGGPFGLVGLLLPLATTVLAVLPRTRLWVAARRSASARPAS